MTERVKAALVVVDVIQDFRHENGDALLASFRERQPCLVRELQRARHSIPVVYANDGWGSWDADAPGLVRRAIERGKGGDLLEQVRPLPGDCVVLKPRYSAFDRMPLDILLHQLDVGRIRVAGMATEMCVTQTAISARELGYQVTVVAGACACVDERLERIALEYLRDVVGAVVEE